MQTASGEPVVEETIAFEWESEGASVTKGDIRADVPQEGDYRGKYMQITTQTQLDGIDPYFDHYWSNDWAEWDGWGGDDRAFVTHYSGKVIAILKNEKGEPMRCRFDLAEPRKGPEGGGYGECEGPDGELIRDVVLKGD